MIDVVTSQNRSEYQTQLEQMWRQRRDVFVDKLGWDLPLTNGMEIDQYDDDRAMYLLGSEDGQNVSGSLRILPTDTGHLMTDLFPNMCAGTPPTGSNIWEISRFYVLPPTRRPKDRVKAAAEVLSGMVELALLYEVDQITMVSYMANMPLIVGLGFDVMPLGLPTQYSDGNTYVASAINVSAAGLQNVRDKHGITGSVLNIGGMQKAA
jgi:N-acyl-L-homoserine lactone synthetase